MNFTDIVKYVLSSLTPEPMLKNYRDELIDNQINYNFRNLTKYPMIKSINIRKDFLFGTDVTISYYPAPTSRLREESRMIKFDKETKELYKAALIKSKELLVLKVKANEIEYYSIIAQALENFKEETNAK